MGLFRPSRERRGPDPYQHWKTLLFAIGAALGLAGIFTERDWLILVAIAVLAVGVALRWLPRPGEDDTTHEPPDSQADEASGGPEDHPPDIPPPA